MDAYDKTYDPFRFKSQKHILEVYVFHKPKLMVLTKIKKNSFLSQIYA